MVIRAARMPPAAVCRAAAEDQVAGQAIAAVLEPLSDAELETIAIGLAALRGAFARAQRPGRREPRGGPAPC